MATRTNDGKDELNLAEFPLCALAHRLRPEQKTLQFEDRVWDGGRNEMITRQLTVTGSDAYGLPTALDDEVLLGLIQLSKLQNFADRKVPFTRYRLIEILGWRNESKSYSRLEASLNRWTGVTLYFQNAWWNKARRCWVDEKFHVLDNVWLCHRSDRRGAAEADEEGLARSALVWNEVLFRSFRAGNLKSLDFDFYKALESATAKRLYRFLDKRFFYRGRWEFNLKEFAWEHAGLARSYDAAGLKRKLRPGIHELERKGYLHPLPDAERFHKVCSGEWSVVFQEAGNQRTLTANTPENAEAEALTAALTQRGVTPSTARETVQNQPADQIKTQMEVFDWLVARKDPKVSRNPPGFLVSAIRGDYAPPKEFVIHEDQTRREQQAAERQRKLEQRQRERKAKEQAREEERARVIAEYWQQLSPEARQQAEQEAWNQAPASQRQWAQHPGKLGDASRQAIRDAYVIKHLHAKN